MCFIAVAITAYVVVGPSSFSKEGSGGMFDLDV